MLSTPPTATPVPTTILHESRQTSPEHLPSSPLENPAGNASQTALHRRAIHPPTPPLIPPLSFQLVATGVYRSGYPLPINKPFLTRLNLRTIINLHESPLPPSSLPPNITIHHLPMPPVKEPFVPNDEEMMKQALEILLDKRNLPCLVHSAKGKHRVGVLVGVLRRRCMCWALSAVFDEYARYAGGKGEVDLEFIEVFAGELEMKRKWRPEWVRLEGEDGGEGEDGDESGEVDVEKRRRLVMG